MKAWIGYRSQREEVHSRHRDRKQETRMEGSTKVRGGRLGSSTRTFQPTETEAENPNQDPFLIISPFYVFEHWKLSQNSPRSILLVLFGMYFLHVVSFVFSAASQMSLVVPSSPQPRHPLSRWEATTPFGESYLGRVQGREGPRTLPKTLGPN